MKIDPEAHDAPTSAAAIDARRVARSTAFAFLATALDKGGAMVLLVVIARLLGPEDFGRYAALMALVALFQVVGELGQEPILVRLLAQEPEARAAPLVPGALAMRGLAAIVAGGALIAIGPRLATGFGLGALGLAAVGLVASTGMALRAVFRTMQRLDWLCWTALANVIVFAAALAVCMPFGLGLRGAVAAWAGGQAAASAVAIGLARTRVAVTPRWNGAVARRLVASGWLLAVNALLLTVTLRVGQLIVLRIEGPTAVGYLTAGSRLAEAFALIPESLMLVLLPVLAAGAAGTTASPREVSARAVRYLGVLALATIVVVSILAPDLLRLLFGPSYVAGSMALRVLVWLALLAASGTVLTNLLIARGQERLLLILNTTGSVLTIGLSLILVPAMGFVGAALAALAASVIAHGLLLVVPATRADAVACWQPLLSPLLIGIVLAIAGVLLRGPRLVVTALALTVFIAALVVTRTIDGRDWRAVRATLAGRGVAQNPR